MAAAACRHPGSAPTGIPPRRQSFHLAVDMQTFSSGTVTAQEMRIIWSWIPERFSLSPPLLLFSTSEDGCSLQR